MGIVFGRASIHDSAAPFIKVGKASVMKLLTAFHHITDGFGISEEEFCEMMADLHDDLQLTPESLNLLARSFFLTLDSDNNGLVDGLETMSCLAICSGMTKMEIAEFCLALYDFNNTSELCFDEVVLSLKSASTGLCKLHHPQSSEARERLPMPTDRRIEELAAEAFTKAENSNIAVVDLRSRKQGNNAAIDLSLDRRTVRDLADAMLRIPEICSWLSFFANTAESRSVAICLDTDISEISQQRVLVSTDPIVTEWKVEAKSCTLGPDAQWKSQVPLLTPVEYANKEMPRTFPDFRMSLGWLYGLQTYKTRNSIHYNRFNDVIYPVSRYIIVYSTSTHEQRSIGHHYDEVTAVTMHPNSSFVASGDGGRTPLVLVWDSRTLEVLFESRHLHQNGITSLAFSADGSKLVSIDNHPVRNLLVTNWGDGSIVFRDRIEGRIVSSVTLLSKQRIVCASDSTLWFWTKYHEGFQRSRGVFPKNKSEEFVVSLLQTQNGDNVISGMLSGRLMLWVGINCMRVVKAHSSAVFCLSQCSGGFLSGGKDSRIRMWTYSLEPKFLFDVSRFGVCPNLIGVSMSADATSILFGTKGGDLFEISSIDGSDLRGGPIVKSHYEGEITGLDCHPSKYEFTTVGTDKTIRVMDMSTKTLLKIATLDVGAKAVAYSPLGDVLAVATENNTPVGASFVIVSEETLAIVHSARDTKSEGRLVRFSPDGDVLALGVVDGSILLYSVSDDYELFARCVRHTTPIVAVDFSSNGEYIRSNSVDGELHFFNVDDGAYISNISSMRDVTWSTQSCMYSWHSKGIHIYPSSSELSSCCSKSPGKDPNVLVAEGEAPPPEASTTTPPQCIVTGSTLGQIRVFSFPAVTDLAEHYRFRGHFRSVKELKFSFDGTIMISVGEFDRTVIQWKVGQTTPFDSSSEEPIVEVLPEVEFELVSGAAVLSDPSIRPQPQSLGIVNEVRGNMDLTRFQWQKHIIPPTTATPTVPSVLGLSVSAEYVFGYETQVLRNNIAFNSTGELVYTSGSRGLIWNPVANSQVVNCIHHNKITAFATSSDGKLVATGDMGDGSVAVWDASTGVVYAVVVEKQAYSVCTLSFSASGKYLGVVSNDEFHTVSIYDWRQNILYGKFFSGKSRILHCCFVRDSARERSGLSEAGIFVTVGVKHVKFWHNIVDSPMPVCVTADWQDIGHPRTFLTVCTFKGQVIVGCADGNLNVFDPVTGSMCQSMKAHSGAVYSIAVASNGSLLLTGGQDGVVRVWDTQFSCMREYAMETFSKTSHFHAVRAIAIRSDGSSIAVGTQGAEIFEISLKDGNAIVQGSQIKGHSGGLYALAHHPRKNNFVSAGDDAVLRVWDSESRRQVKSLKLETGSRAVAFHPTGAFFAVGLGSGKRVKGKLHAKEGGLLLLSSDSLKLMFETKDASSMIMCLKFSPNGAILAAGSDDNCVYTYDVQDGVCRHRHTLRVHTAPLVALDFSVSSAWVMSVDLSQLVIVTSVATGLPVQTDDEVRDETWMSNGSPLLYNTMGLWKVQPEGAAPLVCASSPSQQLLASANAMGDVAVSRYPLPEFSGIIRPGFHSGPASTVVWSATDKAFFTSGTHDCSIVMWRCQTSLSEVSNAVDGAVTRPTPVDEVKVVSYFHRTPVEGVFEVSSLPTALTSNNTVSAASVHDYRDDKVLFEWKSMICAPSLLPTSDTDVSGVALSNIHYYGCERNSSHPSMFYNKEGSLVYAVGNVGIIFDRNVRQQTHYRGHSAEITAQNMDASRTIMATGDCFSDPQLHIWDALTAQEISVFNGLHHGRILAVAFSQSGNYLLSIGNDCFHSLAVCYSPSGQWRDGVRVGSCSTFSQHATFCLYASRQPFPILVGGDSASLYSFRLKNGSLERCVSLLDSISRSQSLVCAIETDVCLGDGPTTFQPCVLVGSSAGFLYATSQLGLDLSASSAAGGDGVQGANIRCLARISAHDGAISALQAVLPRESLGVASFPTSILTVGVDQCIRVWSTKLALLHTLQLQQFFPGAAALLPPSSMVYSPVRESVVLGFAQSSIVELSVNGCSPYLVGEGHDEGELHGMAVNPGVPDEFCTVGDDCMVLVWNRLLKYAVRRKKLQAAGRAIVYSPDGSTIVVGIGRPGVAHATPRDGSLMVLRASDLSVLREERKAKKYITDLVMSTSGEVVIASSFDGRVFICNVNTLNTLAIWDSDSSRPALRVDLSSDDSIIRLAFQPDRLLYYSLDEREPIKNPSEIRDIQWRTWNCPFSWETQGIFRESAAVTAVAVHRPRKLIVVAYEDGNMSLFAFPCFAVEKGVKLCQVATYISRMLFSADGKTLFFIEAGSRMVAQMLLLQPLA